MRLALFLLLCAAASNGCSCERRPPERAAIEEGLLRLYRQALERGNPRTALEVAEAVKCRRIRSKLLEAGAAPHRLSPRDRIQLPRMAPGQALISLFRQGARIQRFLAWRGGVSALGAVAAPPLDHLLARARHELEHGTLEPTALQRLLGELYERLLADVAARIEAFHTLLFLPDGPMRFLPLHALVRQVRGRPRYLAQDWDIVTAPCLGLARSQPRCPRRADILLPDEKDQRRTLEGPWQEARRIAGAFREHAILEGARATSDQLGAALGRRGTLVHFAGHGLTDLEHGDPPELLFEGGTASLDVVTRGPIRAEIVVLASCSAAYAGRFTSGDRRTPEVSFVEALLAAGARTVVAASWIVKDRQSARQMRTFYGHLPREGAVRSMAAAYNRAIGRLRPPHPRFWAAYAVHGGLP